MLTPRFEDALAFATNLHRAQRRKGTAIPYAAHLLAVASLALEMGADEDAAIAALLHDAIEDQGLCAADIAQRYGENVAEMVTHCTDSVHIAPRAGEDAISEWRRRKLAYIQSLSTNPTRSLVVSLADKTHNARSILDDLDAIGPSIFDRFTAGKEGVLWYYGALADAFASRLASPGADRFVRIVEDMRRRAA